MKSIKAKHLTRVIVTVASVCILVGAIPLIRYGYQRYFSAFYPLQYQEEVQNAAEQHGVAPSLIYAMIHTESHFDANATSSANAKGLMQLTESTFEWALRRAGDKGKYNSDDLYNPAVNIYYGTYVIKLLREQFHQENTVLAAYNAGQGRVHDWLANSAYSADGEILHSIPYPETATYIERVNEARVHYQQLYQME